MLNSVPLAPLASTLVSPDSLQPDETRSPGLTAGVFYF
jgi:hypothetical protein